MLLEAYSETDAEKRRDAMFRASNSANMLNLIAPQRIARQFGEAVGCFADSERKEELVIE
jgi:hypothetical protein